MVVEAVKTSLNVSFDYPLCTSEQPVSYTHLDVYKRQEYGYVESMARLQKIQ